MILSDSKRDSLANDPPLSLTPRPMEWESVDMDDGRHAGRRMDAMDERRLTDRRIDDIDAKLKQALMERDIEMLHAELIELSAKFESLSTDRDRALRWGIVVLGSAVVAMGTWIFNLIAGAKGVH